MIDIPLPLEQTDVELAELIKWYYNGYDNEVKEIRLYHVYREQNPYEICSGCNGKFKWCKCLDKMK
jgi:hypothetical protein